MRFDAWLSNLPFPTRQKVDRYGLEALLRAAWQNGEAAGRDHAATGNKEPPQPTPKEKKNARD